MGSDRSRELNRRRRRWICEACADLARTAPEIAEAMRERGDLGVSSGTIWTTLLKLESDGWIERVGAKLVAGKESPLWALPSGRRPALDEAVRRHAAHRIEAATEIVLIHTSRVRSAAPVLLASDLFLWGMRMSDSSFGLAVVLDPTSSPGARAAALPISMEGGPSRAGCEWTRSWRRRGSSTSPATCSPEAAPTRYEPRCLGPAVQMAESMTPRS